MSKLITPTELPVPQEPNWNLVETKFKEIKTYLASFAGRPKHNPYIYWRHHLDSLWTKFKSGDRSKELYDYIMSFKVVPPTVDSFPDQNYKTTLTTTPDPFKEIQKDTPPIDPTTFMGS